MELQALYSELAELGIPLWAITGDEPERVRAFRDTEGIEFEFLLDPDGVTFEAYGILNENHDKTVPHPTVIVTDAERVARYVVSDQNYKLRPPSSEVLEAALRLFDVDP